MNCICMASVWWGVEGIVIEALARLHVDDPQYRHTVSGSQKPYISGRLSFDQQYFLYISLWSISFRWNPRSLCHWCCGIAVLGVDVGKRKTEFFNNYDLHRVDCRRSTGCTRLKMQRVLARQMRTCAAVWSN